MHCFPKKAAERSTQRARRTFVILGLILSTMVSPYVEIARAAGLQPMKSIRKVVVTPKHRAAALLPVVEQKDIQGKHQLLADQVLRALPPTCRNSLKNFYVTYDPNSSTRGLGGESTIIVTGNVPDREFMALIIHECGHVVDLGGLQGKDQTRRTAFFDGTTQIYGDDASVAFYQISWLTPTVKKTNAKENDFVSGYAMTDPFEDFSETFAYYALQQKEFAKLAKTNPVLRAKYNFMAKVVFHGNQAVGDGKHERAGRAPWDVTKLPYIWHAKR